MPGADTVVRDWVGQAMCYWCVPRPHECDRPIQLTPARPRRQRRCTRRGAVRLGLTSTTSNTDEDRMATSRLERQHRGCQRRPQAVL